MFYVITRPARTPLLTPGGGDILIHHEVRTSGIITNSGAVCMRVVHGSSSRRLDMNRKQCIMLVLLISPLANMIVFLPLQHPKQAHRMKV